MLLQTANSGAHQAAPGQLQVCASSPANLVLTAAAFATGTRLFFCSVMRALPSEVQIMKRKLGLLCSARWFVERQDESIQ